VREDEAPRSREGGWGGKRGVGPPEAEEDFTPEVEVVRCICGT
jgi:hypothetical protein